MSHEIGEKDRGSEIDGNLRERERKNRERNLERGSDVSRVRRDKGKYETKLEKRRIKILRRRRERERERERERRKKERRRGISNVGNKFGRGREI